MAQIIEKSIKSLPIKPLKIYFEIRKLGVFENINQCNFMGRWVWSLSKLEWWIEPIKSPFSKSPRPKNDGNREK